MKRCPTCQNTFADSMRFCQTDGTPLVSEADDAYKTIVGGAAANNNDLLEFSDDSNTRISQNNNSGGAELNQNSRAKSDDLFSFENPTMPISLTRETNYHPSPFNDPPVKEPDSLFDSNRSPFNQNPFEQSQPPFGQSAMPQQWSPPPAPEASWQSQNIGASTPFQPPMIQQGQNQTLPIISLVLGIISALCCLVGFLTGPAALITGYLGRKNADENPQAFGGGGMALAGMITGGIGALVSVGYYLLVIAGSIAGPR